MESPKPPSSRDEFEIAIVCALPLEYNAVVPLLDDIWDESQVHLGKAGGDLNNTYLNGRIGQHNVVLVCLPGRMGKASAAIVATDLRHSYKNLNLVLLVGICGGVPNPGNIEVLLGDVIISSSVVQYDFGRRYPEGFRRKDNPKDNLNGPSKEIASTLVNLGFDHVKEGLREKTAFFLRQLSQKKPKYIYPGAANDRVFQPDYRHKHHRSPTCKCQFHKEDSDPVCDVAIEASCEELGCEEAYLVHRKRLEARLAAGMETDHNPPDPAIYIGPVATGDSVMKSGVDRDLIAKKENIIAFEMEVAGMWEHLPSLVVKGVCDYSDSHKSKKFQDYAAATAASVAKAIILRHIPTEKPTAPPPPQETRVETIQRPAKPQWVVPFAPDPEFVDRPEVMAWLDEKSALHGARVAIVGLGGMGKSQLAIQFADRIRQKSHVFWVNATSRRSLEQSYRDIAESLGMDCAGDSLQVMLRRVASWLNREENGLWTVVLDNFDDGSIFDTDDPHMSKLLPQSRNGFTLITSRTFNMAQQLTGSARNIWSLPPLTEDGALELLRGKLVGKCEEEEGRELVRLMDYMPLAISQAAAYINNSASRVSLQEYMELFKSSDGRAKLLNWDDYSDLQRYHDASNSISQTWMLTLQRLQEERPSAIDLLSFMSFFSPQAIPEDVAKGYRGERNFPRPTVKDVLKSSNASLHSLIPFKLRLRGGVLDRELSWQVWNRYEHEGNGSDEDLGTDKPGKSRRHRFSEMAKRLFASKEANTEGDDGWSDDEFDKDLKTLLGYSFVATTEKKGVLKMHPLVRTCTQDWMADSGSLDRWRRRFLMIMTTEYTARPETRDLGIHLDDSFIDMEPKDPLTARLWAWLAIRVSLRWNSNGQNQLATALDLRALSVAEDFLGEEDELVLIPLERLASKMVKLNQYEEAERLLKQLSERSVRIADGKESLKYQHRCANLLTELEKYEEAEPIIQRAIAKAWDIIAPNSSHMYELRTCHASILANLGRYEETAQLVIQLLEVPWDRDSIRETFAIGVPCGRMAMNVTRENVALIESLLRNIAEVAERVFRQIPIFNEQAHALFHEILAECLGRQGRTRFEEAKEVIRRGMELRAQVFPDSKIPMPRLYAVILEYQGKYAEAEKVRREIAEFLESPEGVKHFPNVNRRYENLWELGALVYVQGDVEKGSEMIWEAYQGRVKALGENHPDALGLKVIYDMRDELPETYEANVGMPLYGSDAGPENEKEEEEAAAVEVREVDLDGVE